MIVVYQTGFDMNELLPLNTEVTLGYDLLNGVFTRFQIIIFDNKDTEKPIPFYINYDSNLYSPELVGEFCDCFKEALIQMIKGELS